MDTGTIYFNECGFVTFYKEKALSRRQINHKVDDNETLFEAAWENLGLALKDALSEKIEFLQIISDTAVIDILNGSDADIHTRLSLTMYREIRDKGLPKFFNVTYTKASPENINEAFTRADNELGRQKEGDVDEHQGTLGL